MPGALDAGIAQVTDLPMGEADNSRMVGTNAQKLLRLS
jgi:hypothetical protein